MSTTRESIIEERVNSLAWELGITWEDNWEMMEELQEAVTHEIDGTDIGE